ncbi:MAG: hypothetical protein IJV56_10380 [Neisseriaceae bacterium]|nr:hypothetical protein [Neisseriaceae bacterium]
MEVLLVIISILAVIFFPMAIMIWFIESLISLKKTSKEEDEILYAKRRANFTAASVVFGIIAAIVVIVFYLAISDFSLM